MLASDDDLTTCDDWQWEHARRHYADWDLEELIAEVEILRDCRQVAWARDADISEDSEYVFLIKTVRLAVLIHSASSQVSDL